MRIRLAIEGKEPDHCSGSNWGAIRTDRPDKTYKMDYDHPQICSPKRSLPPPPVLDRHPRLAPNPASDQRVVGSNPAAGA